jgi:DNA-binding response OmpR family regulator
VPIVALTADIQKVIKDQCHDAGMDDYLSKPFSQKALQTLLEKWLPEKDKEIGSPQCHSTALMEAAQHARPLQGE